MVAQDVLPLDRLIARIDAPIKVRGIEVIEFCPWELIDVRVAIAV